MAEYLTALAKPAIALIILIQLMASGCESTVAPTDDRAVAHMKVLGLLYGQYMSEHSGAPPASQDQFVAYLQREPANWEKLASSPQEFLASARGGESLVVLYGSDVKTPADGGFPWVAYEAQTIDDRRQVVNAQGNVQGMNEQEFAQLFPDS